MTKTLREGAQRINARQASTTQVASGLKAATGEPIVLLRLGALLFELTADGAEDLGRSLVAEADIARRADKSPIA